MEADVVMESVCVTDGSSEGFGLCRETFFPSLLILQAASLIFLLHSPNDTRALLLMVVTQPKFLLSVLVAGRPPVRSELLLAASKFACTREHPPAAQLHMNSFFLI